MSCWSNYALNSTPHYLDTVSNKDRINTQFYVGINIGNNKFEDQTSKYFLYDEYEEVLKYIEDSYELYKIKKLKIKSINIDQYHRKNLAKKLSNLIFKKTN